MEEQKNEFREIKMPVAEGANQGNSEQKELTPEQLKEVANKLFNENKQLDQQLRQMHKALMSIDRLEYLLRIVSVANNCKEYSFNADFVQKCIDEIQAIVTLPEDKKPSETEKEG